MMEYFGFGNTLGNQSKPLFNPEDLCILLFGSETSKHVIASMTWGWTSDISRSVLKIRSLRKNYLSTLGTW